VGVPATLYVTLSPSNTTLCSCLAGTYAIQYDSASGSWKGTYDTGCFGPLQLQFFCGSTLCGQGQGDTCFNFELDLGCTSQGSFDAACATSCNCGPPFTWSVTQSGISNSDCCACSPPEPLLTLGITVSA
jgi:hypothetical protein